LHERFVASAVSNVIGQGQDVIQFGRVGSVGFRPRKRLAEEQIGMVSAVVLLKTHRGLINEVATQLAELDGISEVFSVGGRYDLVAILRVRDNEAMADLVTEHMLKVDGIAESETLLAFRAFSRHDLESMFSLGLDE
ncbi:MAG: Lrp/AsnC ligand binding domain-containing protein, partial [Candidatus Promineofilum sp.]|nr:Lrp/AsnC ligand binding domain-containing protein [Promineifilum sp.]